MSKENTGTDVAVEAGFVDVTFDAGGAGTTISCNPASPRLIKGQAQASIEWRITRSRGMAPGWQVKFGNVVLGDRQDHPLKNFKSGPKSATPGQPAAWVWTFDWDSNDPNNDKLQLVQYDIFLVYSAETTSPVNPFGLSLRQITPIDPTILLPPV